MVEREDTITSLLDEKRLFPPPEAFRKQAYIKSPKECEALIKETEEELGDTTTLADPSVVDDLVKERL